MIQSLFRTALYSITVFSLAAAAHALEPPRPNFEAFKPLTIEAPKDAAIQGRVLVAPGTPMSGGMVFLYNAGTGPAPSFDRYWRVPDHSGKLDENGTFKVDVPAGEYFVGALKRTGQTLIGPAVEGDLFFIQTDSHQEPKKYVVAKGETKEIGTLSGGEPFRGLFSGPGLTAIEGTVSDMEGKPVEGVSVFAFITPAIAGKPLFVSSTSNKEGVFLLRVREGGTYYLKARDSFGGGPPRGGALLDGGKAEPLQKVTVQTGETVKGIKLGSRKFPGRGPTKQ